MCGIFGFSSPLSTDDQSSVLREMGNCLIHRGPDDHGYFQKNHIGMGMRRLSIIDLQSGKQPIYSNNGNCVIVYNGEVYNYKDLRTDLEDRGYHFHTETDTEVIVNLYQEKGVDCLHDLNGMFAFAVYDIQKDELFLARDRFGIKPLYYLFENNSFVFGSELKAVIQYPAVNTTISLEAVDLYLTFDYVPAPWSIFENINKLEQGHYVTLKNGKLNKKQWYQLTFAPKFDSDKATDYLEKLDYLIQEAVRRRTVSDVPLGGFLSGGIDSSLISHYLVKSSNTPLKTFSIGFDEPSFDESRYARQMADHLGTEHHEKIFSVDDMKNLIPNIFESMDEPFADASLLPTYFLCSYAKEEVTVALSGDGGDEVFGGYPTYYARKLAEQIPPWTYSILKYGANLLPVNDDNISFDFKAKKFTEALKYDPDVRHQYWLGSFNHSQKQSLFSNDVKNKLNGKDILTGLVKNQMQDCDTEDNWERSLWQDMRFYLQDNMLVKVDRASMMNSLEVRVPLLDHEVVEFSARIPAKFKYRNTQSKYILKRMAEHHLPNEIVYREKKGFGIPIAKWLKKELKTQFDDMVENSELCEHLFDSDYLHKLQDDHLNNRKDNRKLLWAVLVLHECMENTSIK
tara:strand:- start:165 stop:2042 length:1878 start_codon:yes stop_codon:yes gene_type:complete